MNAAHALTLAPHSVGEIAAIFTATAICHRRVKRIEKHPFNPPRRITHPPKV